MSAKKIKTVETEVSVADFIGSFVDNAQKEADSYRLIELMSAWTGHPPKMWGPSIIGFGHYHYQYASGHEGDMPVIAFSPRKAAISLYVYAPTEESKKLLEDLGNFTMGKSCIYVKKLADINLTTLERLAKASIAWIEATYPSKT
ncbi:DUF1801 domain-containing protein [Flavihumibacter petaseus]|uniref:YdhG-like domain-containing protein n=1 Tax=Flavihumibacter petaseus NBRC 106054 TaxID=1220578 RepID=A0A0E9MW98_9BACT|nr:DUF1801 domain-containing protein [Flavihumibacter petaseus]GAO41375.1 hypothetical protein FPE01S_01_03870 [Flavihumibacter petaseus NBRC 106054]